MKQQHLLDNGADINLKNETIIHDLMPGVMEVKFKVCSSSFNKVRKKGTFNLKSLI